MHAEGHNSTLDSFRIKSVMPTRCRVQYGYISGYPVMRQSLAKFLEKGYNKREC